jgi:hypothetical protein
VALVLAIDDAPTADAAALRTTIEDRIAAELPSTLTALRRCGFDADPAGWPVTDFRFVVVRPSAGLDSMWTTPSDDPNLRLQSNTWSPDGTALFSAVRLALDGGPTAAAGAPYSLLSSVRYTVDLLAGNRVPATDAEQHVADAGSDAGIEVVVATTRDDESAGSVATYELPSTLFGHPSVTKVVPVGPGGCTDTETPDAAPRLDAWDPLGNSRVWPCWFDAQGWLGILGVGADCVPRCLDSPIAVDSDGSAECLVTVTALDSAPCDPARGWADPMGSDGVRRPKTTRDPTGTDQRTCEVQQLTGDALEKCRTTEDCPDCGSGWCRTDLTDLGWQDSDCHGRGGTPHVRFVGGALAGSNAGLAFTCNLVAAEPTQH